MSLKQNIALGFVILMVITGLQSVFIVQETEQALVLQFGRPVDIITDAGLKFKLPFIQNVETYDSRILEIDPKPERVILSSETGGLLAQIKNVTVGGSETDGETTSETSQEPLSTNWNENSGEPIIVDVFARYQIIDALKYRQRLSTETAAALRLQNEMDSTTRDVLGKATLEDLLSPERTKLMENIRRGVNETVEDLGVRIVDIRIGRADLTPNLREATYNRMRSEREQQATEIRALGQEKALEIRSNAEKERTVILSEAEREARIIRGQGDKKATKIYADAYEIDEDFYAFYRSLEAYRKGLNDQSTTLVLSPDSEFFEFFKDSSRKSE